MTAGDARSIDAGGPPAGVGDDAALDLEADWGSTDGPDGPDGAGAPDGQPQDGALDGGALHPGLVDAIEGGHEPDHPEPVEETDSDEAEWAAATAAAVDVGPPPEDVLMALDLADGGLDDHAHHDPTPESTDA